MKRLIADFSFPLFFFFNFMVQFLKFLFQVAGSDLTFNSTFTVLNLSHSSTCEATSTSRFRGQQSLSVLLVARETNFKGENVSKHFGRGCSVSKTNKINSPQIHCQDHDYIIYFIFYHRSTPD